MGQGKHYVWSYAKVLFLLHVLDGIIDDKGAVLDLVLFKMHALLFY